MRAHSKWRRAALTFLAATAPVAMGAQTVAITGGTVYPVSGPKIDNGTVLIRDGRVVAVGANVRILRRATRRRAGQVGDARIYQQRHHARPLRGGQPAVLGRLQRCGGARRERHRRLVRGLARLESRQHVHRPLARRRGHQCRGLREWWDAEWQVSAPDLVEAKQVSEMLRKAPNAMLGSFGNPGSGNTNSRGEFWARWRSLMNDVRAYQSRRAAYENGGTREFIARQQDMEALIPVLAGELPLVLEVDRSSDILEALAFAREFGIRLWLGGAAEGWMVAPEIAAARVPVFVGAMNNIPGNFSSLGSRQRTRPCSARPARPRS